MIVLRTRLLGASTKYKIFGTKYRTSAIFGIQEKVYFLILNKILTTFGKISDLEGTLETELSCHLILRFSCYFQSCWYRATDLETSVFNIL